MKGLWFWMEESDWWISLISLTRRVCLGSYIQHDLRSPCACACHKPESKLRYHTVRPTWPDVQSERWLMNAWMHQSPFNPPWMEMPCSHPMPWRYAVSGWTPRNRLISMCFPKPFEKDPCKSAGTCTDSNKLCLKMADHCSYSCYAFNR